MHLTLFTVKRRTNAILTYCLMTGLHDVRTSLVRPSQIDLSVAMTT